MTILFSGFAITESGKEAVSKMTTAWLTSILWHFYFLHALRRRRLWTRKASVVLVIIYMLLLQFYAFSKLYPIHYLFTDPKFSLLEMLRIGLMGFLLITTSNLFLTVFFIMGWVMLFLLIADKKIINEFWPPHRPPDLDIPTTTPEDMGVIEKEKITLSSGYPVFKMLILRIYFTIPILAAILWIILKGVAVGICAQVGCDMPVIFSGSTAVMLSLALGGVYLFFWSSFQGRKRWTRVAGIVFALMIGIFFPTILIILSTGLILHYLVFDGSVKNAFSN